MKYLVPLARANQEDCERLAAACNWATTHGGAPLRVDDALAVLTRIAERDEADLAPGL